MQTKTQFALAPRQVCLFFIAFIPIIKFFTMPSTFAQYANEDLWICAILLIFLDLATIFFVLYACRKANTDFITLLEYAFGKNGKKIILWAYFLFFMLKSITPLIEQNDYISKTLYMNTPNSVYFLPFFVFSFYLGTKKLRVLGRCADIMFAFTIIGYALLLILSISGINIEAILPIFANDPVGIAKGSYFGAIWFGDAVYLMFFIGEFACRKKESVKVIVSFLVASLMSLIFLIVFYCAFTSIAFRQRFALTEIAKYTTAISNTGRLDYIAIMLILVSSFISLSLPLYFATRMLNIIFDFKKKFIAPLIVNGIILAFLLITREFLYTVGAFILNFLPIVFITFSNILPCLCAILVKINKPKENAYEKT